MVDVAARGLGWNRDAEGDRKKVSSTRTLFGAIRNLPRGVTLRDHLQWIKDQLGTSMCVGEAIQQATNLRLSRMGIATEMLSALTPYTWGRCYDRRKIGEPIYDMGSRPFQVVASVQEYGLPYESVWPSHDVDLLDMSTPQTATVNAQGLRNLNVEPPFDVVQKASAFEIKGINAINAPPSERLPAIKQAIASGYPVIFGAEVDRAFMQHVGSRILTQVGPRTEGGHMMVLIGYEETSKGTVVEGLNSWGKGWGDNGLYQADESFITDPRADSFYVISIGMKGEGV